MNDHAHCATCGEGLKRLEIWVHDRPEGSYWTGAAHDPIPTDVRDLSVGATIYRDPRLLGQGENAS